ncbi:MAG: helix-turn-helix domain-containing protein [Brevundimonas sp.]|jgi:hypothetical protein|nr:helix-turn-helix domain-containing protein [Brevundimonas sp.]
MTATSHNLSLLDDRWLTTQEAATYIGVKVETLSKWRLRGLGPCYSAALGRDPRYRLSDLLNYMATKMATNTREAKAVRRDHKPFENGHFTLRRGGRPARGVRS